jgi:hypothetical protein
MILAFFCLNGSSYDPKYNSFQNPSNTEVSTCLAHYYHSSQSESSFLSFIVQTFTANEKLLSGEAIIKYTQQLLASRFTQYTGLFLNTLIRFRKANLIFPFHNFW